MSSDGRYMYHQPGMNTNYDYSAYPPPPPPPSYDNSQIAPPPPRQIRSSSSTHPQSPHQPYNPPVPSYPHPNYGPGPYMAPPPQHQHPQHQHPQWSESSWAHYNQSYGHPPPPPPPPPIEGSYTSVPGRSEVVPGTSMETREYGTSNMPDTRRIEERPQPPPPNPPPPPTITRRREHESPPAASPGTPTGLDFMKLLESYRAIIDETNMSGPNRSPTAEAFERMVQSATYGAQLLESATLQQETPPSEAARSPKRKEPEEPTEPSDGAAAAPSKRQQTEDVPAQEGQSCRGCGVTSTPEWRRGPLGPRTLCNACGLVYAKLLKKRVRDGIPGASNGAGAVPHGLGDHSGEGDSDEDDDDDEYGSQDLRSNGGRD